MSHNTSHTTRAQQSVAAHQPPQHTCPYPTPFTRRPTQRPAPLAAAAYLPRTPRAQTYSSSSRNHEFDGAQSSEAYVSSESTWREVSSSTG